MDQDTQRKILQATKAAKITGEDLIQSLWSDFGTLCRLYLEGGDHASVILKHIRIPEEQRHPKGFATELSKSRKVKSYEVETEWYRTYNEVNLEDKGARTPRCLTSFQNEGEFFILLEDLDEQGYNRRIEEAGMPEVKAVLSWLANFHAKFLNVQTEGLWDIGTYWHLATRPDELKRVEDKNLQRAAPLIDQRLRNCKYQTLVHGDAKLANFCFSYQNEVAAVDFQYVGQGCGMKDVAYFIGSCFSEELCEKWESDVLDFYFSELKLVVNHSKLDFIQLEKEWREMYSFAWADFTRFMMGWNPSHKKIHRYSQTITEKVISRIYSELLKEATAACKEAGSFILSRWKTDFKVSQKKGSTPASSVVTEIDLKAQEIILSKLRKSMQRYDLGLLAEESDDDQSRLQKDFFWTVDPLDGTKPFSEGKEGFAVSIALVSKEGKPEIGAILNPVTDTLFHAIYGQGAFQNEQRIQPAKKLALNKKIQVFADESLKSSTNFGELQKRFEIHFLGGAVVNVMNVLECHKGCYFKFPKKKEGGCAIWDLAAASLILQEAGGLFTDWKGCELNLNNPQTIYFNATGFIAASNKETATTARKKLQDLKLNI